MFYVLAKFGEVGSTHPREPLGRNDPLKLHLAVGYSILLKLCTEFISTTVEVLQRDLQPVCVRLLSACVCMCVGMRTGRCIQSTKSCEVFAWCPVERNQLPLYETLHCTDTILAVPRMWLTLHYFITYFRRLCFIVHKLTPAKRDVTTVVSGQRSRFTALNIDDYNISGIGAESRS